MKKKIVPTLIIIAIVLALVCMFFISRQSKKIPANSPDTLGNNGSNLINGGLFCEDDGKVYFSNSYDSGSLYSMNVDETDMRKIIGGDIKSINAGGKYLYYYLNNSSTSTGLGFVRRVMGVYRITKTGKNVTTLNRNPAGVVTLYGNTLYFQHYDNKQGMNLCSMDTRGDNLKTLLPTFANPACIYGGKIYYNDTTETHFLYTMDTMTLVPDVLVKYNMWNPIRKDNYIYFMDMTENYRMCRYSLEDEVVEILSSDRVDTFNVTDEYVYYQKNSETEPALMRVTLDGSVLEKVADGNFTALNATSRYLYFKAFDDDFTTYRTPVSGDVSISEFTAALFAAGDNQ